MLEVIFDGGERIETHRYPADHGWQETMHGFIGIVSPTDKKVIANYRLDRLICIRVSQDRVLAPIRPGEWVKWSDAS